MLNKEVFGFAALFLLVGFSCFFGQSKPVEIQEIIEFQSNLNKEYLDKETTPLRGENFRNFKEHPFFPINLKYRVEAKLERLEKEVKVDFPTSSGKSKTYRLYAKAHFVLDGKPQILSIYQSEALMNDPQYKDYLFLPYRDLTAGKSTYGGGKYIDLRIPKGETIVLDFNKSYHPYCAYNAVDYSCPIVPKENELLVRIPAGVKYKAVYY